MNTEIIKKKGLRRFQLPQYGIQLFISFTERRFSCVTVWKISFLGTFYFFYFLFASSLCLIIDKQGR
jgi:hypothetical protein